MVPVGTATLGRIMDVLGNPIDEAGPIGEEDRMSIHRAAPSYEEQSSSVELLETGIKVIDLVCPFAKGGKVKTSDGRFLWFFNWNDGGFNQVYAKTKAQANSQRRNYFG